jgi:hypothetical protein
MLEVSLRLITPAVVHCWCPDLETNSTVENSISYVRVVSYRTVNYVTHFCFSFKKLCIKGYRILRRQYRQIVCLFKLMMNCDLTELNSEADMAYLRQTFSIDIGVNEQEACDRFEHVLLESYRSSVKTRVDWVFHALNHINS